MTLIILAGLTLAAIIGGGAWAIVALRRHIDDLDAAKIKASAQAWRYQLALLHVQQAGTGSMNGTARKMARMAGEAVGER
jgi:hypothetical protein